MRHKHTQIVRLYLIVVAMGVGLFDVAWLIPEPISPVKFVFYGAIVFVLTCSFHHLTVSDKRGNQGIIR